MSKDFSFLRRRLGYLDHSCRGAMEPGGPLVPFGGAGWSKRSEYTYARSLGDELGGESCPPPGRLFPEPCGPEDLVFFDLETTGLSGGAGNFIFLVGLAQLSGGRMEGEQYFLRDFPGEREFLELVVERLGRGRVFVSFNGKTFDSHLLRMRCLLNGLDCPIQRQIDLLTWSRRLWKGALGSCSLGVVEREILGIHRPEDVPGCEVPDLYFRYLRTGDHEALEPVFAHNSRDVRTLIRLFTQISGLLEAGLGSARLLDKTDLAGLGRYLLERREARGEEILAQSFRSGSCLAGEILSLHHKRAGNWGEAVRLWTSLASRGNLSAGFACRELAKYYEHRARDLQEAVRWAQELLRRTPVQDRVQRTEALQRKARLERKLKRNS